MESPIPTTPRMNPLVPILGAILLINILGFSLLYLRTRPPSAPPSTNSPTPSSQLDQERLAKLEQDIATLKSDLSRINQVRGISTDSGLADSLPELDIAASKSLTIKDSRFSTIDVFELPVASSKVVGRLDFGKSYPYTSLQNSWYQVQLSTGLGWVNSDLVLAYE